MHCADVKVRVMQQLQICSRVAQCGKANLPPRARPRFLARNGEPIRGANPAAAKKGLQDLSFVVPRGPNQMGRAG